jgi:hypothetical protein
MMQEKKCPPPLKSRAGIYSGYKSLVSPLGLEPRTHGLKGRCSAIELGARRHLVV